MSAFGRIGWGTHFMVYPVALGLYFGAYKPYAARSADAAKQAEMDTMAKAKVVDPDNFQPFSPIPFHNNPEMRYVFAEVNMRKYVNEHHINVQDYQWRNYFDSYDHANKRTHVYNWSSV